MKIPIVIPVGVLLIPIAIVIKLVTSAKERRERNTHAQRDQTVRDAHADPSQRGVSDEW